MSNFTFLKTDWPELYETAREAEQSQQRSPDKLFLCPALAGTGRKVALRQ